MDPNSCRCQLFEARAFYDKFCKATKNVEMYIVQTWFVEIALFRVSIVGLFILITMLYFAYTALIIGIVHILRMRQKRSLDQQMLDTQPKQRRTLIKFIDTTTGDTDHSTTGSPLHASYFHYWVSFKYSSLFPKPVLLIRKTNPSLHHPSLYCLSANHPNANHLNLQRASPLCSVSVTSIALSEVKKTVSRP